MPEHRRKSAKKFYISKPSENTKRMRESVRVSNSKEINYVPEEKNEDKAKEDRGSVCFPSRHAPTHHSG
jgi:hypothetical protein